MPPVNGLKPLRIARSLRRTHQRFRGQSRDVPAPIGHNPPMILFLKLLVAVGFGLVILAML